MSWLAIRTFLESRLGLGLIGAIALGLAVWGAVAWHGGKADAAIKSAVDAALTRRDAEWQASFDSMKNTAGIWKGRAKAASGKLADERKARHEEDLRRIGALADDLRLRGPGQAAAGACRRPGSDPALRAATGGYIAAAAGPDAPGDRMPAQDGRDQFAIVRWDWLVRRGEEFDALLSEATTWRAHDAEQRALHEKSIEDLRRQLDAITPKFGQESQ